MSPEKAIEQTEQIMPPAQIVKHLQSLPNDLTTEEILDRRLRGKRWESIGTDAIYMDILINDKGHVRDLSGSIFGDGQNEGLGQISPINTAVFKNGGVYKGIYYLITDGFHRTDAFIQAKAPRIDSICLYGLTLEEVYDLRVLAANSVKSTSYARVIEFMQKSYEQTYWFKVKGITLLQAFSLCVQNTSGVKLQLEPEQAMELKRWGFQKARCWGKVPATIFQMLLVASKADPELVRRVRVGVGGGQGEKSWNPARLKAIADIIPNKFELQNLVYQAVIRDDLVASETARVARVVADYEKEPDIVELVCSNAQVVAQIADINPDSGWVKDILLIALYHDLLPQETIKFAEIVNREGNEALKDQIYEDPKQFIMLESEAEAPKQIPVTDRVGQNNKKPQSALDKVLFDGNYYDKTGGYNILRPVEELKQHIADLEAALTRAQIEKGAASWKRRKRTWWQTIPGLSIDEKEVFTSIFIKRFTVKQVCRQLKLTENQIVTLVMSGIRRYFVNQEQALEDQVFNMMYDQKQ